MDNSGYYTESDISKLEKIDTFNPSSFKTAHNFTRDESENPTKMELLLSEINNNSKSAQFMQNNSSSMAKNFEVLESKYEERIKILADENEKLRQELEETKKGIVSKDEYDALLRRFKRKRNELSDFEEDVKVKDRVLMEKRRNYEKLVKIFNECVIKKKREKGDFGFENSFNYANNGFRESEFGEESREHSSVSFVNSGQNFGDRGSNASSEVNSFVNLM